MYIRCKISVNNGESSTITVRNTYIISPTQYEIIVKCDTENLPNIPNSYVSHERSALALR